MVQDRKGMQNYCRTAEIAPEYLRMRGSIRPKTSFKKGAGVIMKDSIIQSVAELFWSKFLP
jgi:hypothetical protein